MNRTFVFRTDHWIIKVEMELKEWNNFTCSWQIWTECYWQCREEINEILCWNKLWEKINKFWKKYHLNDLHPGTEKQEKRLNENWIENRANDYENVCKKLEDAWLLYDDWYKFGSGWKRFEIPYLDLKKIQQLIENWF